MQILNMAGQSTFGVKLRHDADQRIALDLDEGEKVNYGKFGDFLAEVKQVTGNKCFFPPLILIEMGRDSYV